MEALCQGDISALNHIYNEFKTPLYAFIITLTKNHVVAEDLLQETFVKVYDKANQYTKGSNLKAWIFSIARNLAYDYLRSSKSKWDELDDISESIVIEDEVLNKLNISRALFILQDIDREIVIMHVVGGFKHSEIAKALNLNSSTVRWKYREAIKKLNNFLDDKEPNLRVKGSINRICEDYSGEINSNRKMHDLPKDEDDIYKVKGGKK